VGWLNDPNGLVYQEGEWHLYYQYNPYGWNWGNMHWGHAISKDLVHWREQPIALYQYSDTVKMAFSGCAVIDHQDTSGFGKDGKPPLAIALTDTGAGEIIAYSHDNGRSFEMYEGNPVIKHAGRDPKISWHEPTGRWVMALYSKIEGVDCMAFYTSPDLKEWTFESKNEGYYECPDLFELPVSGGEPGQTRWVIYAGDSEYAIGSFDGREFTPEHEGKHRVWYGNYFAAQSYDNAPDGRRVQIGWARGIDFKDMPFNQQMAVPVELSLYQTPDGVRMAAYPVPEIEALRGQPAEMSGKPLTREAITLVPDGEGLDLEAEFEVGAAGKIELGLANATVYYDAASGKLAVNGLDVPLAPADGTITLRILLDRGSIELFANGGQLAVSRGVTVGGAKNMVTIKGSDAAAVSVSAWPMKSIWQP
jgi:fructan beta-fructosidase